MPNTINNDLQLTWYYPNILNGLLSIDYDNKFYKKHGLRPPAFIIKNKLISFGSHFLEFLELINNLQLNNKKDDISKEEKNINKGFVQLIWEFDSLYDTLADVTLWLYDIKRNKGSFIHQDFSKAWIDVLKTFHTEIKDEIDRYLSMNNIFSHTSSAVDIGLLFQSLGDIINIWFFIVQVRPNGAISNNEDFHPTWNWMMTASSFNKELRDIYFLLYRILDLFETRVINPHKIETIIKGEEYDDLFEKIYHQIQLLPLIFFPNEESEQVYISKTVGDKLKIQLKNPQKVRETSKFTYFMKWDWHSNQFTIPYFKWEQ